jgi:valyl-tRNA synthetase
LIVLNTTRRHIHEVPEEAAGPSLISQQLAAVRKLQRIRKASAAMEVAMARNILMACEQRAEEARETLRLNLEHVARTREAQRTELVAEAPRDLKQLNRWRRSVLKLLEGVQEHRENLAEVTASQERATEELLRRQRVQRRLEAADQKYSVILDELAEGP